VIAVLGGLLTAALLVGALQQLRTGQADAARIEIVARSQIDDAVLSLDSSAAGPIGEEARQCKTPLAFVTLALQPGAPPASIRIRSGNYLSPSLRLTDAPRRIAVPFPAPYPTGRGVLSVEGAAQGLTVWLSPAWRVGNLTGIAHRNVVWVPTNPC